MEAHEMSAERPRKGIWYVVGSVPLLTEMLMLVLDRLHRAALAAVLLLAAIVVAVAFVCACLLVPRQEAMVIGTRHCIEYNYGALPGLDPPGGDKSWFQSWRIDNEDLVCTRVEPHAEEEHNRELFRRFFIDGKLHTSFQMPLRKERQLNPFHRYNRFLKGYLSIDLDTSNNNTETSKDASVRLRLGGRNGNGTQRDWYQLGQTEVPLNLDTCERRGPQEENSTEPERCVLNQQLFELASLDHQYYLLNVGVRNMTRPPLAMNLLIVYQTQLYTLVCLHVQAAFAGLLLLLLVLFLYRVRRIYIAAPAGHCLITLLAVAVIIWDVPLGYIALDYDMSWLGIVDAVRLDLFYLVFLCFCFVFVREQAFVKGVQRSPRRLLVPLLLICAGCLLLLALDVTQVTLLLGDAFAGRPDWLRFCLAALLVLNALYVLVLCAAAACGWRRGWNRTALPGRYRLMMVLTCLTAAAACVEHAERRESDNWWFWSWTEERPTMGHLLYIGMLVWYNVFVATLLVLYLPTRPLVELAGPVYEDEQKVPLNGGDGPEPIRREATADEP